MQTCVFLLNRDIILLIDFKFLRLPELETEFAKLLQKESNWSMALPHMKDLYSDFVHSTHALTHNIIYASCDAIDHESDFYRTLSASDSSLYVLNISGDIYVPYDFSTDYIDLDNNRIMVEKSGISQNGNLYICNSCHRSIAAGRQSVETISNYRWIEEQSEELRDLT